MEVPGSKEPTSDSGWVGVLIKFLPGHTGQAGELKPHVLGIADTKSAFEPRGSYGFTAVTSLRLPCGGVQRLFQTDIPSLIG
jgi:hypothetical protein